MTMKAWYGSLAKDTLDQFEEATVPGDVLALSGERAAGGYDVLPSDLLLEDGWEDPSAPVSFSIGGRAPSVLRMPRGRACVTQAQGRVKRVLEDIIVLGTPGTATCDASMAYRLPASIDLRPLLGRRVRLTLEEPTGSNGGQTAVVRTLDDHVWLVAQYGALDDVTHAVGGATVRLTLSPKEGGPLVVSTPELRHIVAPGGDARLRIDGWRYVAELVSRDRLRRAACVIADERLWH
jgi:hypothetical protein